MEQRVQRFLREEVVPRWSQPAVRVSLYPPALEERDAFVDTTLPADRVCLLTVAQAFPLAEVPVLLGVPFGVGPPSAGVEPLDPVEVHRRMTETNALAQNLIDVNIASSMQLLNEWQPQDVLLEPRTWLPEWAVDAAPVEPPVVVEVRGRDTDLMLSQRAVQRALLLLT